jgi:16S rRNA (cytosine967-C5)-methyltransferase
MPEPKPISPARRVAFEILLAIQSSSAHSDDLLHSARMVELSQADRNLATALVMGVLRWQIALDAELTKLLDRPDQALPEPVLIALRLGAFQLRHMDRIPAHAALNESVELARAGGHPKASGMVNAILRKFAALPVARKPIVENADALAVRLAHPAWLVRRWDAAYGRPAAQAVCEYDQQEPQPGDLFVPDDAVEHVDRRLIDDGSRLVAELTAVSHASPERIWDACAAPGGKAAVLARRHPGAELLATDLSASRLQSMQRRLAAELPESSVRTLKADAAKLPAEEGSFDLILCDVPCSGTGTLARNPEIRHRLQPAELSRQAARQKEILATALKRLRPGGRAVYSTCSLEPEENEAVLDAVLAASENEVRVLPMMQLLDDLRSRGIVRADAPDLNPLVRDTALRTLPGANFQGDGFFAVVIARER